MSSFAHLVPYELTTAWCCKRVGQKFVRHNYARVSLLERFLKSVLTGDHPQPDLDSVHRGRVWKMGEGTHQEKKCCYQDKGFCLPSLWMVHYGQLNGSWRALGEGIAHSKFLRTSMATEFSSD